MAASKYDFVIEQGSSFRLAIVYKDKNKNIVDISNWCARLVWRTDSGVTQIFTTENNDNSLYNFSIDGPNGKLTLLLPANTTGSAVLTPANVWDYLTSNISTTNSIGERLKNCSTIASVGQQLADSLSG